MLVNSILHDLYVRRMIVEPDDPNRTPRVAESTHEQTDGELTEKKKQIDSCDTAHEIWLRVKQMMKGSDIGAQDKKVKWFNEWEKFNSTGGESIESYYHRQIARNQNGFNAVQNAGNQNVNQNGNGNVVAAQAEGNGNGNNENQIRCYNCRGVSH
ncbi:hypothetical protein Tco_1303792 [Tanacetum coccineum]